jgi:hypothetical protein
MHLSDIQKFRLALESVREDLVLAVHAWHAKGGRDEELAIVVDGSKGGKPVVSTAGRKELELAIPDFEPTIAIEFARHPPGQAPAVVDLPGLVRRVVWIDLTPPYTW